jgi:hypothetical protein
MLFLLSGALLLREARERAVGSSEVPQSATRDVDRGKLEEVLRLKAYLVKLEELYRRGEVSERAYRKLRDEYESKLRQLEGAS